MLNLRSPFFAGWLMILIAASIPIIFSFVLGMSRAGVEFDLLAANVTFKTYEDHSFISTYISFGLVHVILCLAITYYGYDVFKATNPFIFSLFRKHHMASFLLVSLVLIAIVVFCDTSLEYLSNDLLWIGLDKTTSNTLLFEPTQVSPSYDIKMFDLIPTALIIAAFLPASAIMLAIPHMIEKVEVQNLSDPQKVVSDFLNEFELLYYLMVGMLVSSSIATHFYLKTPFVTVDESKSVAFANIMNSTFAMWSMIYFLVLLMVLMFSYALVSLKIRPTADSDLILTNTQKYKEVRTSINFHFMIKKKSALFASAFTPVLMLAIKQAFS